MQLITLEGIEADGRAKRADNADVRKSGLQPLAKALDGAEADQFWRHQRRMRSMPAVMPQPHEMFDFSGVS
jgi:hypothetical protein